MIKYRKPSNVKYTQAHCTTFVYFHFHFHVNMVCDKREITIIWGTIILGGAVQAAPTQPIGTPIQLEAIPFALSSVQIPTGSLFETARRRNLVRRQRHFSKRSTGLTRTSLIYAGISTLPQRHGVTVRIHECRKPLVVSQNRRFCVRNSRVANCSTVQPPPWRDGPRSVLIFRTESMQRH